MIKKKLPKKLLELASSYSGDESWEEFASSFDVDDKAVGAIVKSFNVHLTVARVIEWHIGEQYAEQWCNKKIPILYNYKPIDLLKNYKNGETCLRVILRQMH